MPTADMPAAAGDEATGAPARPGLWARLTRRLRALILGLGLAGVAALLIGFLWFQAQVATAEPHDLARADGIVVLTGGASRITDAIELLESGRGQRLLITGVHPTTRPREISRGVPQHDRIFACCVDLDRSALNTLGNALQARQWAMRHSFRSLIVVTSAYHMPRAMAELAHQLPDVSLVPFPVVTEKLRADHWWTSAATTKLLILEYLKYIVAVVRMQIDAHGDGVTPSRISAIIPRRTAVEDTTRPQ